MRPGSCGTKGIGAFRVSLPEAPLLGGSNSYLPSNPPGVHKLGQNQKPPPRAARARLHRGPRPGVVMGEALLPGACSPAKPDSSGPSSREPIWGKEPVPKGRPSTGGRGQ